MDAFSGEGASRHGGRWNHLGVNVLYTAGSLALAALEILVHLESQQLLQEYLQIPVEFDERHSLSLNLDHLPANWSDHPAPPSTREIGTEWIRSRDSVVLAVPSAIVPDEKVYLLNPEHPQFTALQIGRESAFHFDPRLLSQ